MKVAFYLPVVTPWWFDTIVARLVRVMAAEAEVHVLVPPLWRGTGIGFDQLAQCADLEHVHWHILDDEDHASLRTRPANPDAIVDLLHEIAPDYVLCRSADAATPAAFPGKILYMMESGAPPLATANHWLMLQPTLYDHGFLPQLDDDQRRRLREAFAPDWEILREREGRVAASPDERRARRAAAGLPADRPVIAVPLDYEHQENFFKIHSSHARNIDLVQELAETAGDDVFLAITNHPLNDRFLNNRKLHRTVEKLEGRAALLPTVGNRGGATTALTGCCDGMIVGNSKSYAVCGFFETPFLRMSTFGTGPWLNAYSDRSRFLRDIANGAAAAPNADAALDWFAFHVANDVFDLNDPEMAAGDIIGRFETRVDEARWDKAFDMYRQHQILRFG